MQNGDKGTESISCRNLSNCQFSTPLFPQVFCLFICHQKSNNSDIVFDCSKLAIDGILSQVVDLEQSVR